MTQQTASDAMIVEASIGRLEVRPAPDGSLRTRWLLPGDDENAAGRGMPTGADAALLDVADRLRRALAGDESVRFDDVPTPDGPPAYRACWEACRRIPRGRTWSYARLASEAGLGPGGARVAGQAMRRNPLPVIIPCHRVVAADGRLHGFAGSSDDGGAALALKAALLRLEAAPIDPLFP
ncbi:MAG: MGMT family protein [Phycisphaeraceae bacterium]|nr:methylated-DNA--[protein]-cysteine S-methyltransferase [Phycisphaerales bacterium]QOJ17629.1 MAG: MGMT family protein [Phycisphaeraceae bacterium]